MSNCSHKAGAALFRCPFANKGEAFTKEERAEYGLSGLLPTAVSTVDQQVERMREMLNRFEKPIDKALLLDSIRNTNEDLFFQLLTRYTAEYMPVVYTPTVGEYCQRFSHIFRYPRGLFVSLEHLGHVREVIEHAPNKEVDVIVVTDGERILGLGDQGLNGMGIPCGITLIVGGGYHGKSTLLNALELGIYNHISGDGREYVITDSSAQKLRSEDGRFIKDVDISLFINDLPNKKDTLCFSTEDASGSTSQAAGIVESMEAGSKVFLLDEDTSATNFMVRDSFMQRVICREKEPITPFLERARDLYEKAGISTILVAGSSGAFFHIADTVIQMDNYHPVDITEITGKLCQEYPLSDVETPAFRLPESHRIMTRSKAAPSRHSRPGQPERLKTKVHGKDGFSLGKTEVDLRYVEQLIDSEQTASLALLLKYACEHLIDGKRTLPEIVTYLDSQLKKQGLSFFSEGSYISCGYAMPRIQEIYSCFNRYRRP